MEAGGYVVGLKGNEIRHYMPDDIHAARGPVFGKPTPWQAISASSLRSDLGGEDVDDGEGEGHVAQPVEGGGGDEDLGFGGEEGQQGAAAGGVELAEDVIDEEDGGFAGFFLEEGALSHLEGDGQGALLAFGGEFGGAQAGDEELEVISMGADGGEAGAFIGGEGVLQLLGQGAGGGGLVVELHLLAAGGDAAVVVGDVGLQALEQAVAELHDDFAVLREEGGVAAEGGLTAARVAEQGVAAFECLAVGLQCLAVDGVPLAAEEIEVAAALFCGAVDEGHVAVGEPGDGVGIGQVVVEVAALGAVYLHVELAVCPVESAGAVLGIE